MNVIAHQYSGIHSLFSLQPLVAVLEGLVASGKPGAGRLYDDLLEAVKAAPELLEPTEDIKELDKAQSLVQALLATIFPPAISEQEGVYAIAYPFQHEIVYASDAFRQLFLTGDEAGLFVPGKAAMAGIIKASLQLAYNLVLRAFYKQDIAAHTKMVHGIASKATGLTQYFELKMDAGFVDVKLADPDFSLPKNIPVQSALDITGLKNILPLEHFQFEGFVVIEVTDVTSREIIADIKNSLLSINNGFEGTLFAGLQSQVQTLLGITQMDAGITPFLRLNDFNLFADTYFSNSLLLRKGAAADKALQYSKLAQQLFAATDQPLLYGNLTPEKASNALLQAYYKGGVRSLVLCPLKCEDGELIGLLELTSTESGTFAFTHLTRLLPAMQLFALSMEKHVENLELQVDKVIKQHFTAIQPAVEWKFTEAAFNYLQSQQAEESIRMAPITFADVYPLYGAIDVRNSSLERNNAIRLDMVEQLSCAAEVLDKAAKKLSFPLLQEVHYKISRYLASAADALLSDDEMAICDFLQQEVHSLFEHLQQTRPELDKDIDRYFSLLDKDRSMVYRHRKQYEDSITRINDVLDRFVDGEQKAAQKVYPHYFERYITDGVEFNIYVGQSLAPAQPFDEIYVRNLKLWQLTMLARAAKITRALEQRLPMPLQTTQLILAHSIPLNISFRRKERKFDVDGAYNIRYEIIKKRIDKVHLKDSEERLTQPGKIAIVYSQQKELNEYLEYIDYLQHEGLLDGNIEHLDLEDTQGISGLKAIRVDVNFSA